MDQSHRRFTTEQVRVLLQAYCQGTITRAEAEEVLESERASRVRRGYAETPTPTLTNRGDVHTM